MNDWYTLLVPIGVLAALMLFRFVGCGFEGAEQVDTDDPYENAVEKDTPVVYYRLQETEPATIASEKIQHKDGQYEKAPSPLNDPAYLSPPVVSPSIELGAASIMPKELQARAVRVNGGFVAVPQQIADLPMFSLEALVSPEWDVANQPGFFYCVIENSMRVPIQSPQKNAGFAIFAGPDDINNPSGSPYTWQLWIGTGNEFARADPVKPDPKPLVKPEPTYLAVTFGDTQAFLYAYTANTDVDAAKFELIRRPYVQATQFLRIGIADDSAALVPPFPGPANFLYPFVGEMAEVAIYDKVLPDARIISHIMSAFDR